MQGLVWPGAETPYQVFTYTYIHIHIYTGNECKALCGQELKHLTKYLLIHTYIYIYILVMNARPCVARS